MPFTPRVIADSTSGGPSHSTVVHATLNRAYGIQLTTRKRGLFFRLR
jgi:hypothetical protein